MKGWQIGLFTVVLTVVLLVVLGVTSLWNNLSSEWQVEKSAAQFALNHSPIESITSHDVFTGSGTQEVFQGKDSFGRSWYVVVYGNPFQVQAVETKQLRKRAQIETEATKDGLHVIATHLGYLDTTGRTQLATNSRFVFEVYSKTQSGTYEYAYFDAQSGKLIQSY